MTLNIDINNLEGGSKKEFKSLPDGEHKFMIVNAEEGTTKSGGHPKITMKLEIEHEGTKHTLNYVNLCFHGGAQPHAKAFMTTVGVDTITDASDLVGRTGICVTKTEDNWPRHAFWGPKFKSKTAGNTTPTTPNVDEIPF
jgi:hypothetical protein